MMNRKSRRPLVFKKSNINKKLFRVIKNVRQVRKVLEEGADVNTKNSYNQTPLMIASSFGKIKVVEELLKHDVDINCQDKTGMTALMYACVEEHYDIVVKLLKAGADPFKKNNEKENALDMSDDEKIIRLLSKNMLVKQMMPYIVKKSRKHRKIRIKLPYDLIRYMSDVV